MENSLNKIRGTDSESGNTPQYELLTPISLTEVLNDISNHYSAAYQDFADAVIQLKTVINYANNNSNIWDAEIVKEAVTTSGEEYVPDLVSKFMESSATESDFGQFLEDKSTDFFNNYLAFGDYALNLEAMVALIENVLKEELSEEEYNKLMSVIAEKNDINSLDELIGCEELDSYRKRLIVGTASNFGLSMKGAGLEVLEAVKAGRFEIFSMSEQIRLIKESFMNYIAGAATTQSSPLISNSKIVTSLGFSAVYFGFSLITDIAKNEVTLEKEIVNAARAGVMFGAGMAGTAVTAYLAGAGFAAAGPVGAGVSVAASIVGNFFIDAIYHMYKYSSNDIPRQYEDISVDQIKEKLEEEGYAISSPKFSDKSTMSAFDVMNTIINCENLDFANYVIQSYCNFNILSDYKTKKYEELLKKVYLYTAWDDPSSIKELLAVHGYELDEEEEAFLDSYCKLLFERPAELKDDPDIRGIYYHLYETTSRF